ncbi:hypothetical protein N7478_010372 [Penicillium angulare]|uniref:uncharacterized protein n=1 Tax=Penicillium angulare TaxID=116970 RepID=UPI002540C1ED|nr:uncharacterized protein N7478_010372 [Penicillium angulare]KAJ5267564.1 hypothetical protein N7478_010372 [Penicillium angulare]
MPHSSILTRSRQKSCVACAEGKRRCSRQSPQCSRCLARGIPCRYMNGSSAPRQSEAHPNKQIATAFPIYVNDLFPYTELAEPLSNFNDNINIDSWFTMSSSPLSDQGLSPMHTYPELVALDKWSTNQILQVVKGLPQLFFKHNKTPFIHPRLYDSYLPLAIQDAFTVTASYCTKSPETEDMVFRILESKADFLVGQDYQSESLENLLAAVQALMLFQTIQLFDGNIRQRSIAERNLDTVRLMTFQLHIRATEELKPASTWREWIFAESIRRTAIMSFIIEGVFSVLKSGLCSNVPFLSLLPFTTGSEVWEDTTDATWVAGSGQVVLYGDFSVAWEKGLVLRELDTFEKFLLAPCLGEKYQDALEILD